MFGQNDNNQGQPVDPTAQNPMLQNSQPPAGFFGQNGPVSAPSAPVPEDLAGMNIPADATMPSSVATPAYDQPAPMIMDNNPTDFGSPSTPDDMTTSPAPTPQDPSTDALLGMKQEALQQLTPLVGHLDQTPEEKFRTVMMMIQASDDHSKLNEAFDLAKQIVDEKIRAQALLDVINEINYFTQQH